MNHQVNSNDIKRMPPPFQLLLPAKGILSFVFAHTQPYLELPSTPPPRMLLKNSPESPRGADLYNRGPISSDAVSVRPATPKLIYTLQLRLRTINHQDGPRPGQDPQWLRLLGAPHPVQMQADLEINDGVDQRLCAPAVLHPPRDSQDTPSLWTDGRENAAVWN